MYMYMANYPQNILYHYHINMYIYTIMYIIISTHSINIITYIHSLLYSNSKTHYYNILYLYHPYAILYPRPPSISHYILMASSPSHNNYSTLYNSIS